MSGKTDADIQRLDPGEYLSGGVIHERTVYLAGQVGEDPPDGKSVAQQTRETLAAIDRYLARASTDKSRLLSATIWLADIADFDEMNREWIAWLPKGAAPARACIQARLFSDEYRVEIMVTAALRK